MKTQTINEIDVAAFLRIARNVSKKLELLQNNYCSVGPDHAWLYHQQQTIDELIEKISDKQVPWWKQLKHLDRLTRDVEHINAILGSRLC